MNLIKKYISITHYSFKQSKVYWFNTMLSVISSIIFISIAYYMWNAIFLSGEGFDYAELNSTITYVIIITIINHIVSKNTEMEIGNRIVSGNLAMDFIRPVNFFIYLFFNRLGVALFSFIFSIIPLLFVAIFIFDIKVVTNVNTILIFALSVGLSFILIYIFEFLVGLVSFWTNQVFGVSLLKASFINIMAGLTIPLNFYPDVLQNIFINLPFQAAFVIPVSIYIDEVSYINLFQKFLYNIGVESVALGYLLEQLFWIIIVLGITTFFWKLSRRVIVIQGG